ncbi:MAG: prepilin-type N-terminal cleavage/methylation domain-containing protein [Patescibacteria group bacterium]
MPLLKTYTTNKCGFSLIEVLVALSILSIVGSIGLVATINSYNRYEFNKEKNLFINSLQESRSKSLNNVDNISHNMFDRVSANVASTTEIIFSNNGRSEIIIIDSNGKI